MNDISNAHRALWMVLITSLSVPFFAALAMAAVTLAASLVGAELPAFFQGTTGDIALSSFVWASFPATIAAFALVPFVLQEGTYGWLHAAVAGVAACGAAAIIFPIDSPGMMPVIAFAGGLFGIVIRLLLINVGVLKP